MDLLNLLNYKVWIDIYPSPLLPGSFRFLVIVFAAFLVSGVITRKISKFESIGKLKKIAWGKIASMFAWMGIFGLIYLFFAFERIPVLSMRLLFLFWLVGFLIWLGFIAKYVKIDIPRKEQEKYDRKKFSKYLPKKKKK